MAQGPRREAETAMRVCIASLLVGLLGALRDASAGHVTRRPLLPRRAVRAAFRAHPRRGRVRAVRRDAPLRRHRDRAARKARRRASSRWSTRCRAAAAQARVRLGDDAQRGAGLRGALRQLPVARHHDLGVRQGARPPGRHTRRCSSTSLGAQRRHVPRDRPRQPDARAAQDRRARLRLPRRPEAARERGHDDRLPAARRTCAASSRSRSARTSWLRCT